MRLFIFCSLFGAILAPSLFANKVPKLEKLEPNFAACYGVNANTCLEAQKLLGKPKRLKLVFVDENFFDVRATFGHIFLKIQAQKNTNYSLEFNVNISEDDSFFLQTIKIFLGGYRGFFAIRNYAIKEYEYAYLDGRNIYEFELNLSDKQIDEVLKTIIILSKKTKNYDLFMRNCALELAKILQDTSPFLYQPSLYSRPFEILEVARKNKLINFCAQKQTSQKENFYTSLNALDKKEKIMLKNLLKNKTIATPKIDKKSKDKIFTSALFYIKSSNNQKYNNLYVDILRSNHKIAEQKTQKVYLKNIPRLRPRLALKQPLNAKLELYFSPFFKPLPNATSYNNDSLLEIFGINLEMKEPFLKEFSLFTMQDFRYFDSFFYHFTSKLQTGTKALDKSYYWFIFYEKGIRLKGVLDPFFAINLEPMIGKNSHLNTAAKLGVFKQFSSSNFWLYGQVFLQNKLKASNFIASFEQNLQDFRLGISAKLDHKSVDGNVFLSYDF